MSRFNTRNTRPATGTGPIMTQAQPTGTTHERQPGYAHDAKSELFLLAVVNLVGKDTFYENADARDGRFEQLVREVAIADAGWMVRFVSWLRTGGNMRTASLVAAVEAVKTRLDAAKAGEDLGNGARNRELINAALQRADEPGELLAYWSSRYGRALPKPVKRGIGDAVRRLYTEYALLKYDTDSRGYRFADVLDLTHPDAASPDQGRLFTYALDRRHGRGGEITGLPMIDAQMYVRSEASRNPETLLDTELLRRAGMTWEDALSLAGSRVDKAKLWQALIPTMGYMALLRNLRNFDQAGVSDEVAERTAARIADPEQVAKSRQFPFRFLSAYRNVPSLRWGHALEKALTASLNTVPALPGRTLVLVDQSPSMFPGYHYSTRNSADLSLADQAKIFGTALALRSADATLVGYGHANYRVQFGPGEAVLRLIDKFRMVDGTDSYAAAADHYDRHDRIVVITDGENNAHRYRSYEAAGIPSHLPIYTWNLAGYKHAGDPGKPNRLTLGGLTDAAFRLIPLVEAGRNADWDAIFSPAPTNPVLSVGARTVKPSQS